ncbi:hypothetical protein N7517_007946 [Penicillium concentricum]|uniref:Secreted protein n=1 Tax=Penicillium concentricum TaxID=293559 RepID=A0A9W9RRH8_9EURO|nr:uncharacterized protein N7517_007946 [Penicillium concentricum]KAJ5365060.1 hypothetical protein N7517_007946 [Penicillium concentricum]
MGMCPAMHPYLLISLIALMRASIVSAAFSADAVVFGDTVGNLTLFEMSDCIRSRCDFFGFICFALDVIGSFKIPSWVGFGWVSEKLIYTISVFLFRSLFE